MTGDSWGQLEILASTVLTIIRYVRVGRTIGGGFVRVKSRDTTNCLRLLGFVEVRRDETRRQVTWQP